jgi:hypothetical protein
MVRRSTPASSKWVAKQWRNVSTHCSFIVGANLLPASCVLRPRRPRRAAISMPRRRELHRPACRRSDSLGPGVDARRRRVRATEHGSPTAHLHCCARRVACVAEYAVLAWHLRPCYRWRVSPTRRLSCSCDAVGIRASRACCSWTRTTPSCGRA